jgi:hypothetical protein
MLQHIGIDLLQLCTAFINFDDLWNTIFTAKTLYHKIMKRIKAKLSSMTSQFFASQSLPSQVAFVKIALIDDPDVITLGVLICLGGVSLHDQIKALLHIKMKSNVVKMLECTGCRELARFGVPSFRQRWEDYEFAQLDELVRIHSNRAFVIQCGTVCEACDYRAYWHIARIIHIDVNRILVHYFTFTLYWDEFIPWTSVPSRLAPLGTRKMVPSMRNGRLE